jgi:MFS family permease
LSLHSPKPRFTVLFACLLVVGAGNSMLLSIAPPLVRELDLPDSSVGWIFSPSALIWTLASPHWGRLSDRLGRRRVAAIGLAGFTVSMSLFAAVVVAGQLGWAVGGALLALFIASRAIFGAFGSATPPASQAYVADRTLPVERTEQLAGLTAAFALGSAFGPALSAAAAAKFGLVAPIVFTAAIGAAATCALWRHLPETAPAQRDLPLERTGGFSRSLDLARDRRLSGYLIYGATMSVASAVLVQIYGLYTMDRLSVAGAAGAEFTAAGFMVSALALLVAQWALLPRLQWSSRQLMLWGAGIVALGVTVQIVAGNLAMLLVAQAIQGIGFGLARPGYSGGASVSVRPEEQGAAAGLVVAVNGGGFIVAPLLGGVAYEQIGLTAPLWITLALLAAMFVFAQRSRRLRHAIIAEAPSDPPTP